MEMDSSRRSFDSLRELGVKKPRLREEVDRNRDPNGRGFLQQSAAPKTGLVSSRLRANERLAEGDDSSRGAAYLPQPPHQELVSQYKTALGELTFNSKPIITNLTIIAGENLQVAKTIAASVCSNIIEVPSDQKLPSLYLLDSIVKNIGGDYIKYFAAKLPEVFCVAYRQVDSSVHSAMRHLFGTWKGVFPPQCLQMIEKELGFSVAVNGSSSLTAASRPERPPHSIHVNPKYLEARQRIQQSNKTVRSSTALGGEPVPDKKIGAHENYKYVPDLSRTSSLGIGRVSERVADLRHSNSKYVAGSGITDAPSSQKTGLDVKSKFVGSAPRCVNGDDLLQATQSIAGRHSGLLSRNWKNSEEEEYIWDNMGSKLDDQGAAVSLKRDRWAVDDAGMEFENHLKKRPRMNGIRSKLDEPSIDSPSMEWKDPVISRHRASSPWSMEESHTVDALTPLNSSSIISRPLEGNPISTSGNSLARVGLQLPIRPARSGAFGFGLAPNASPSSASPLQRAPPSPSSSGRRPLYQSSDFKAGLNSGELHNQAIEGPVLVPGNFQRTPSPSRPSVLKQKPMLPQISKLLSQPSVENSPSDQINARTADPSEQPSPTSLLEAVMKSGILSNDSATSIPPKPAGQSSSAGHNIASNSSQIKAECPLPPSTAPVSDTANPISNLLSSLVAKGLISSSKSKSPPEPTKPHNQSSSSVLVSAAVAASTTSVKDEISSLKTDAKTTTDIEIENLLGFEFKPEIIRESHPSVISGLFDDLHRCSECGLRLRLKDCLDRHMEWHALKIPKPDSGLKESRKWYMNTIKWVGGGSSPGHGHPSGAVNAEEIGEMVVADERQCVCILCGELFEDFYSVERDEWMFRDAVYMNSPTEESASMNPVVHAKCLAESSLRAGS